MDTLAYNMRQLNSLTTSLTFNFAVICETNQMDLVEQALKKCYDHVSRVFAHNEGGCVSSKSGMLFVLVILLYCYMIYIVCEICIAIGM